MATTKLTLTVKPDIVRMAKVYASKHGTSVSATFSHMICSLVAAEKTRALNVPRGSALEILTGILRLPEGQTTDDLRLEALAGKYGLEKECLITRNTSDFPKRGKISVLTPEEFLHKQLD
jgi:hypothetical protein